VNVAPGSTFEAVIDTGETGLAGVITVEANDNLGVTSVAATSSGISELASGVYAAAGLVAPDTAGHYTLIWKNAGVVLGIEDLVVTYTAPAAGVPGPGPYVDRTELQRVLGKTAPTADELAAMDRVLAAAASEIDWDVGYTADNPAPAPPPSIVAEVNLERAAERFDSIADPDQSGPLAEVGAPDPVVADRQLQDRVVCVQFDVDDGCVRVLGGVGQRF
jgi:hypothetical protein